ncbi:hypothetical protein E2562_027228 [Oryza meyeriana var. granulata]|uniref:Uncharacterized protein n=1 Tax=Oryza meyeriana var. granulata TaxID=110450 RepID=A0A6G1D8E3_9ORYZ|nr:hypothetical protein E2562_027228 [Oryza meyeriana var. granulata]
MGLGMSWLFRGSSGKVEFMHCTNGAGELLQGFGVFGLGCEPTRRGQKVQRRRRLVRGEQAEQAAGRPAAWLG